MYKVRICIYIATQLCLQLEAIPNKTQSYWAWEYQMNIITFMCRIQLKRWMDLLGVFLNIKFYAKLISTPKTVNCYHTYCFQISNVL